MLWLCGAVFCGIIRIHLYHLVEEERAGCFTSLRSCCHMAVGFFFFFFLNFSVSLSRGAVVNRMYLWKFLVILTCIRDT